MTTHITIPYAVADFADLRERGFITWTKPGISRKWKITTRRYSCAPAVSAKAF